MTSDAPLRLVVFDMDGTLIDSQALILAAMDRAFAAERRAPPPPSDTLGIIGLSLPEAFRRLAPSEPAEAIDRLCDAYRAAFVALRAETGGETASPLYPGAREAVARLAAQPETLLGVATGKAMRGLRHALEGHDLARYFQTLQTADLHPSKPHPSMLLRALEETGADAAHAVMIGDTEYDMEMARNAGFRALAVTWGYHDEARLRAAGADAVIHGYEDLDAALAALDERD
ncbi:MAG: HAD-IA family hydrolase [Pseudomonadota bacterium]|nr:HAD-IA family hydrolase [Pseudomonadota bacterium]